MSVLEIAIVAGVVLTNFLLIGFVYIRNPKSATHKLFALLVLVMNLYLVANFFSVNAATELATLRLVRVVMLFAAPMSVLFFLFVHTFPRSTMSLSRRATWLWSLATLATMATAVSPYLFIDVTLVPGGSPQPNPGPGMLLFIPIAIGTIPLGLFYLIRNTIRARGIERTQSQFLLAGVTLMFALIISFVFISTVFFAYSGFVQYAPLFTLPFVVLTSYTMVRHRMMDFRAAIARSLALTMLVGVFFILYAAILIFGVPFLAESLQIPEGFLAAVGALIAVVIARYVQDILKQITNRYLFKGKPNYQAALVRLGQELSSTIQIEEVTDTVLKTMQEVIRVKKVIILLQDEGTKQLTPRAARGAPNFQLVIPRNHILVQYFQQSPVALMRDELKYLKERGGSPQQVEQYEQIDNAFEWLDVSAAIPLFVSKELTGIILLGDKLSGDPYLAEDVEFMSAFGAQAATALENARLYKESLEFGEKLKDEVERATHDLAVANEQLKDLDKAKSEFLSIASHQLYTPLTALNGYLSMITEGDFGKIPEKQAPIIDILQKSTNHLITLIKNLLDVSRIEAGRLELELESANLVTLADLLVQDLLPNAINKNLDLVFHQPAKHVPNVVVDGERIRQVLLNFIDNAIKYTPSGKIDVRVTSQGDKVIFSVTDTGKGMTQMEIKKLFNKFTRVGGADRFHTEGTGLGLYVAKQIVEEHHGEVKAESPGKDQGSVFSMILPAEGTPLSLKVGEHTSVEIKAAESPGRPKPAHEKA